MVLKIVSHAPAKGDQRHKSGIIGIKVHASVSQSAMHACMHHATRCQTAITCWQAVLSGAIEHLDRQPAGMCSRSWKHPFFGPYGRRELSIYHALVARGKNTSKAKVKRTTARSRATLSCHIIISQYHGLSIKQQNSHLIIGGGGGVSAPAAAATAAATRPVAAHLPTYYVHTHLLTSRRADVSHWPGHQWAST